MLTNGQLGDALAFIATRNTAPMHFEGLDYEGCLEVIVEKARMYESGYDEFVREHAGEYLDEIFGITPDLFDGDS